MKNLLIVVLLALSTPVTRGIAELFCCKPQHQTNYYRVTPADRRNYVLKIDQDKIIVQPDEITKDNKRYGFIIVPLMFINKSNDTLIYIDFTCSWSIIYDIDNENLSIPQNPCDSNFPTEFEIPPHKMKVINVPLNFHRDSFLMTKFRIGVILQKYMGYQSVDAFLRNIEALRKNTTNRIWSNTVKIPRNHF